MTTIELKYDAFNIKTLLTINGTERSLRCFGTGRETCLREWIGDFFPELIKLCNLGSGSECIVQFYGTQSDYEDISNAHNEFLKANGNIKIDLPPFKRYPQSLSEIREYTENKRAEYEKEISAQKAELEKANAAIAEKAKLEAEKTTANLDELENKASRSGEMLESVYQKELERIRADIAEIRQKAELLPLREEDGKNPLEEKKPLLMSERFEKLLYLTFDNGDKAWKYTIPYFFGIIDRVIEENQNAFPKEGQEALEKLNLSRLEAILLDSFKGNYSIYNHFLGNDYFHGNYDKITEEINEIFVNTCKMVSQYNDSATENICRVFSDSCTVFYSIFSSIIDRPLNVKPFAVQSNYVIDDKNKKPWLKEEEYTGPDKGDQAIRKVKKTFDDSQKYIDSVIDDVERYCVETLLSIRTHYENELKTAFVPIAEKIKQRKENLNSLLGNYLSTSEDKSAIEKTIMQLEVKNECLAELSIEIDRIQGD
jgi:hypothetical protein